MICNLLYYNGSISGKSLIYIKNSKGPKMDPCGTPVLIFFLMNSYH